MSISRNSNLKDFKSHFKTLITVPDMKINLLNLQRNELEDNYQIDELPENDDLFVILSFRSPGETLNNFVKPNQNYKIILKIMDERYMT